MARKSSIITAAKMAAEPGSRLRVCLLGYRSHPHCGGQGVYLRYLSRALVGLGHQVEVVSGPPYPELDEGIRVHRIGGLDLYNPDNPFRMPSLSELKDPVNLAEWVGISSMGFPEPWAFGVRAYSFLYRNRGYYDVLHDNQSLAAGILKAGRWIPTVATIHHPITVDRDVALHTVRAPWKKAKILRWYSFIGMQKRVARGLLRVITVSECSRRDIHKEFGVRQDRMRVVPNGINTGLFRPLKNETREKDLVMVTNSADTPLKGLYHLLIAIHQVRKKRPVRLMVIGTPKKDGGVVRLVRDLDLGGIVTFTGRLSDEDYVRAYARTTLAAVPSLYEGFGFPAGEAMACGVPVVSTTGGALPEVVGDAGVLVPTADPGALRDAVIDLLDHPDKAEKMGRAGYERVHRLFTWRKAAELSADVYREAIRAHRGL